MDIDGLIATFNLNISLTPPQQTTHISNYSSISINEHEPITTLNLSYNEILLNGH